MSDNNHVVMTPEEHADQNIETQLKPKRHEFYAGLEILGVDCPKGSPNRRKAFEFLDEYATIKNATLKRQIGLLQRTDEEKNLAKKAKQQAKQGK